MNATKRCANQKSAKKFADKCVGETRIEYAGTGYYDVHYTKVEAPKVKPTLFTHMLPGGQLVTRNSKNAYTHIVLFKKPTESEWGYVGWSSSAVGADAVARKWRASTDWQVVVEEVNGGKRDEWIKEQQVSLAKLVGLR
jgi:hypothetical protein